MLVFDVGGMLNVYFLSLHKTQFAQNEHYACVTNVEMRKESNIPS